MYDEMNMTWEKSYIHGCLQNMYQEYFSNEEKDAIVKGRLGPLFLLSEAEIKKYFPTDEQRRAIQYCVWYGDDESETVISMEHYFYWLRKEEGDLGYPFVSSLGEIQYDSGASDEFGIRPAVIANAQKVRLITAKKGFNQWHHLWDADEF